jgi:dienelactone hydrolase
MFYRPGGLDEKVAQWLEENLKGLGTETEVSFQSEDGWKLQGTLVLPDGISETSKIPGVVFVHGFMHDQQQWYHIAREVVKQGIAALLFDWRGTRKSINEGKGEVGVDLYPEESDKIHLDVKAAINLMASQKQVDAGRMGVVAA